MDVRIKKFSVSMEVKSKGIEFEIKTPDGSKHLGDCYLTMAGLIWSKGKTTKEKGKRVSWEKFIEWMESRD